MGRGGAGALDLVAAALALSRLGPPEGATALATQNPSTDGLISPTSGLFVLSLKALPSPPGGDQTRAKVTRSI